jgi:hypothetical protein
LAVWRREVVYWSCARPFSFPLSSKRPIGSYSNLALGQMLPAHVCVAGVSSYAMQSPGAFWHFLRGYFFEVVAALFERFGAGFSSVRLTLGDITFPCDTRHTFMQFFDAVLQVPPTVDPGCRLSRHLSLPVLTVRRSGYGHEVSAASCPFRQPLREVALTQFPWPGGTQTAGSLQGDSFVLLQRQVTPLNPVPRGPLNGAAVRMAAARLCAKARLFCHLGVSLESLSWHEQLRLLFHAKVLTGYHGSGMGAGALWLPAGAVVLEFQPPTCWWCGFALSFARPNCTSASRSAVADASTGNVRAQQSNAAGSLRLTWILSTTRSTPVARWPAVDEPDYFGCVRGLDRAFATQQL